MVLPGRGLVGEVTLVWAASVYSERSLLLLFFFPAFPCFSTSEADVITLVATLVGKMYAY